MGLTKVTYSMIEGASINVLDFGADPTGTEDSTAAIQAAIDSVTQQGYDPSADYPESTYTTSSIFFPDGIYKFSTLNIPYSGITLFGTGIGSTRLETSSATSNAINIYSGDANTPIYHVSIRDLEIGVVESVTKTAGVLLNIDYGRNIMLDNLLFTDFYDGLVFIGCYKVFANSLLFQEKYGVAGRRGISLIHKTDSISNVYCSDIRVYNSMVGGNFTNPLYIESSDWVLFHGFHCNVAQDAGVILTAPASTAISQIMFTDCYFDSSVNTNIRFIGTDATASINRVSFSNCEFLNSTYIADYNVEVQATTTCNLDQLNFDNCYFRHVHKQNIFINGANVSRVRVVNSFLEKQGTDAPVDSEQIYVNCSLFQLSNNIFRSINASGYSAPAVGYAQLTRAYIDNNDFAACTHADKIKVQENTYPYIARNNQGVTGATLSNDQTFTLLLPNKFGTFVVSSSAIGVGGIFIYRRYDVTGSICKKLGVYETADYVVTKTSTGAPTGLVDEFVISVDTANSNIYFLNKRGFAVDIQVNFLD
jgi:uncharacterized protein YjbI with pentapeptide repeats